MGLKCKLQKSAQPTLVEKTSEKVITGFFHSFTIFNTSQLFYLLSFFGVIGFLLWLLQPSSQEDDSKKEDASSSSLLNETKKEEDENYSEDRLIDQAVYLIENSNLKKRFDKNSIHKPSKYPIDTIYESTNEIAEDFSATIKQTLKTTLNEQKIEQKNIKSESFQVETSKINQSNLEDNISTDLIIDEIEKLISNKNEKKLEKQDSNLSENDKKDDSGSSTNSLLELYNVKHLNAIEDHFRDLNEVSDAIKVAGLENSQLIFGIDFTISNLENGTRTFNGRSLHYHDDQIKNPYQKVIEILGKTLECFDVDGKIPAFGFGDTTTKDRKVFSFSPTRYCNGFKDVLVRYNEILKDIKLSGPTNFAPLIKEAIKIVKETKQYHILVIVADGQVTNERQTRDAIVEASKYALSIIMVGVGDGPWDMMNEFDDSLPKRQFDNFQFVNYHEVIDGSDNPDETFALNALMEIPDQYKAIKELNLLGN